jgi:hypothetical protein
MDELIVYALIFSAGLATAGTASRIYYTGAIAKMELAAAQAKDKARDIHDDQQAGANAAVLDFSDHQAEVQPQIVTVTKTIVKEIPRYVQDTSACVTVGLVRVLNAAAIGTDPANFDSLRRL